MTEECPEQWSEDLDALQLADLYTYERYSRAVVCSDYYTTSTQYKRQTKRDNAWILFEQHTEAYEASMLRLCPPLSAAGY